MWARKREAFLFETRHLGAGINKKLIIKPYAVLLEQSSVGGLGPIPRPALLNPQSYGTASRVRDHRQNQKAWGIMQVTS